MRKIVVLLAAVAVMAAAVPSQADDGRHGHPSFGAGRHVAPGRHFHGRGFVHRPFAHRHFIGPRIAFGVPFVVGPPVVYPGPYAYAPDVVAPEPPPVYIQPPQQYWYYCPDAQAYYPSVQQCPSGWVQVAPQP
jgi:hypothetical protein